MSTAQELLGELRGHFEPPAHPWNAYVAMLSNGDSEGMILSVTAYGFTIPVVDGEFDVYFPGGMTKKHWDYFSPHLDEWSKTLLAEGVLRNVLRPANAHEWDEALVPLRRVHGPNVEDWLPQLIEQTGFDGIALTMQQAIFTSRQTAPASPSILKLESTGLWHSDDYRVCKDKAGTVYNCTPVVAKLIEVLNLALKQGVPELNSTTLLKEALKRSADDDSLASQIRHIDYQMSRIDHILARCGVWKTLVVSGVKKGCYRLTP